jgi:single-strand DNA-binding protein
MANLNKVLLIGRLTRDPESRSTHSGNALVTFGLAINRNYTRQSGEKVEETCFVDCEAWGKTGETIARYTRKGRPLFVEGRLRLDAWEKEGQKRSKLVVVVEGFQFLDSGGSREGSRGEEEGHRGSPVASRAAPETTPQDDYGEGESAGGGGPADDIPF